MSERNEILTLTQGFFMGGARNLHHGLITDLHQGEYDQEHSVLSIYQQVFREQTLQYMESDHGYQALRQAGIGVDSLGRLADVPYNEPYSEAELSLFVQRARKASAVLLLKEQPAGLLLQSGIEMPAIAALHRSDPEHQGQAFQDLKVAVATGRIALCTISAHSAKEAYVAAGLPEDKVVPILNGIDLKRFTYSEEGAQAVRQELGASMDAPVVAFAARYDAEMKDVPLFLRSARQFLQREPEAHIIMCGTGMLASKAELMADITAVFGGRQAPANVHLLGPRHDMPDVYSASDIVSSTSAFGETHHLCLQEAKGCGAIPVTTAVGDAARITAGGEGILTTREPAAIAEAWQYALKEQRQFRAAIALGRPALAKERMVAEYAAVIQQVLH
jgi:glycosyltransferase involved in cell wall biosynthesis